jgi:prepilin signal peptidase PulO-like enzyme (type II secretory pathway)
MRHGISVVRLRQFAGRCNFCTDTAMLMTFAIVLLVLWGLGLVSAYTMGGFIHILVVVAIVLVLVQVIQGRKVV